MSVNAGDTLTISHYSKMKLLKTIALRAEGNLIVIKLIDEFVKIHLLEGDPLVCGLQKDNIIYTYGCTIVRIRAKDKEVELNIDSINTSENKRQHERFPVSFYADIRMVDGSVKQLATVKNLSYYGVSLLTKVELNQNELIEMDMYIDNAVVFAKGNIVRLINHENWIEYGISMVYDDVEDLDNMKKYVTQLKKKQEESIRSLM